MTSAGPVPPDWAATARGLPGADRLTYPAALLGLSSVCACADHGAAPEGYLGLTRWAVVGEGVAELAAAGDLLLSGQVHRRAGAPLSRGGRALGHRTADVHDAGGPPPLSPGDVVTVHFLGLRCPCLVLDVERTDQDVRMTYGTLPGHVEIGEESFSLRLCADVRVIATVSAFSLPGHPLTRFAGAAGRAVQRWMTGRYVRALQPDGAAARRRRRRLIQRRGGLV